MGVGPGQRRRHAPQGGTGERADGLCRGGWATPTTEESRFPWGRASGFAGRQGQVSHFGGHGARGVPLRGAWRRRVRLRGARCRRRPASSARGVPLRGAWRLRVRLRGARCRRRPASGARGVPLRGAWRLHGGRIGTAATPCPPRWDGGAGRRALPRRVDNAYDRGKQVSVGPRLRRHRPAPPDVPLRGAWRAGCPAPGGMASTRPSARGPVSPAARLRRAGRPAPEGVAASSGSDRAAGRAMPRRSGPRGRDRVVVATLRRTEESVNPGARAARGRRLPSATLAGSVRRRGVPRAAQPAGGPARVVRAGPHASSEKRRGSTFRTARKSRLRGRRGARTG
jgi:hypothetical protein